MIRMSTFCTFSIPQIRDACFLQLTHVESQKICVCIRSHFGLQPFRPLHSCMLDHLEDMPILNMIFGRSGTAAPSPKPLVKRRASPLRESPARDEEDETSDCPMEQVAEENPSASQQPDNVNMEQADYDRDTDNDDDPHEEEQPSAGNPKPKAMPHPKLVPKSPPPTLRLVSKAKPAPRKTLGMRRQNPTTILVNNLHFQGDQRCGQLSHPTIGGIHPKNQIPASTSRGYPYIQDPPSWPNTTGSALPSSTRIRISTSFLSMNENLEPGSSG